MATIRKRRRIPADVEDAIKYQLALGRSPKQVEDLLSRHPEIGPRLPTERTIQRIAKGIDTSSEEAWTVAGANPEDVPLILPVLRELAIASDGQRLSLTWREAAYALRVIRAAPDLVVRMVLQWALTYARRDAAGEAVTDLDIALAFAPWRGQNERSEFSERVINRSATVTRDTTPGFVVLNSPEWLSFRSIVVHVKEGSH